MTDVDFFMHPDYIMLSDNEPLMRKYYLAIKSVVEGSSKIVLVNPLFTDKERVHFEYFKQIQFFDRLTAKFYTNDQHTTLESNFININGDYRPFGHIHHSSWGELEEICENLTPKSHIRIHGCFYGQCCKSLALQLYGLLKYNEHWYNWENDSSIPEIEICDRQRMNFFNIFRNFKKTNIRYGVVFSGETISDQKINSAFESLPFVLNINEQLTDEQTKICGEIK